MIAEWTAPKRTGWPFLGQLAACGTEVPTVTNGDGFHFLAARLFAHVCRVAACPHCSEWRKLTGVRTLRITKDEMANGVALDKIGAATWKPMPKGGLF